MSLWASTAYVHSPMGRKWTTEIDCWRTKIQSIQESGGLRGSKQTIDSNLVLIGEEYSEDDVMSAFQLDWHQMKWKWLDTNFTEQHETMIRRCLQANYGVICRLFSHYCGYGQGT